MLPIKPFELTELIFDAHVFLQQAAELERAEVDFPDTVADFFQADALLNISILVLAACALILWSSRSGSVK